jgi:hypothetical protein
MTDSLWLMAASLWLMADSLWQKYLKYIKFSDLNL